MLRSDPSPETVERGYNQTLSADDGNSGVEREWMNLKNSEAVCL
jgi:hypothetical protein